MRFWLLTLVLLVATLSFAMSLETEAESKDDRGLVMAQRGSGAAVARPRRASRAAVTPPAYLTAGAGRRAARFERRLSSRRKKRVFSPKWVNEHLKRKNGRSSGAGSRRRVPAPRREFNDRVLDGMSRGAEGLEAPRVPRRNDDFVNDKLARDTFAPFPREAPANAARATDPSAQGRRILSRSERVARRDREMARERRSGEGSVYDLHGVKRPWQWELRLHGSRIKAMDGDAQSAANELTNGFVPEGPEVPYGAPHGFKLTALSKDFTEAYDPDVPGHYRVRSQRELQRRMRLGLIDPADFQAQHKYTTSLVPSYDDPVTRRRTKKFRLMNDAKALELLYPTFVTGYNGNTDPVVRYLDGGLPVRHGESTQPNRIFQVPMHADVPTRGRAKDLYETMESLEQGGLHDTDSTRSTDPTIPNTALYNPLDRQDPGDMKAANGTESAVPAGPGGMMNTDRDRELTNTKYGYMDAKDIYGIPAKGAHLEEVPFDTKSPNYQGLWVGGNGRRRRFRGERLDRAD
jgi:hypothetical protein